MEIAPIPNLIPIRVSAPSAAPPDVPTTRAIDFRRQQNQDHPEQDDATYTPGGSEDENDQPNQQYHPVLEALQAAPSVRTDDPEEPGEQHTISVFA
ncbi:hypothetical protein [Terracidiphilus gabretensis]|uniref:hypothetical protein n=1 Tax=Terracidiphilus gabretensis TaxID=1577687 RepID=UPI00071B5CDA|nr:hypothetical protein [Terracidiphilus gabretensis]